MRQLRTKPINATEPEFYEHSGQVSIGNLLLCLLWAEAAALVMSWPYAYIEYYMPLVKARGLICVGFGLCLGYCVAQLTRRYKIRNTKATLALNVLTIVTAYYMAWIAWLHLVLNQFEVNATLFGLISKPDATWELIILLNQGGVYSVEHGTESIKGNALTAIWIGEFVIFAGSEFVVGQIAEREPFCELCQNWCKPQPKLRLSAGTDQGATVIEFLKRKRWDELASHRLMLESPPYVSLTIHVCADCGETLTLDAYFVTVSDSKSPKNPLRRKLLRRLLITRRDFGTLQGIAFKATAGSEKG